MDDQVTLRAFREADLAFLERMSTDPLAAGEFVWSGFGDPRRRRQRWERDGYLGVDNSAVAIALADTTVIGIASWESKARGGVAGGCFEIGMGLLPEYRGRGLGTTA